MSKRSQFFIKHLIVSILISILVIVWVLFIWYPAPLAKAVGVTHIFLMMLTIDVILGPLLGLLVYKEGKKTLKFDLSVIIGIQIAALCYGIYSIEQGRPVWLVYYVDRIELIKKNEIIEESISKANNQYQQVAWLKPEFVTVESAKDNTQRNNDLFTEVLGGISIAQRPERYVDFVNAQPQIQKRAQSLADLRKFNDSTDVDQILTKYPQANAFIPLKATSVDMTVLVNKGTGQVIQIVDLRPWN